MYHGLSWKEVLEKGFDARASANPSQTALRQHDDYAVSMSMSIEKDTKKPH